MMNFRAIVMMYAAALLTACGTSHETKPAAEQTALVAPHSRATSAARSALVGPQSGASEAARAAGAESRKLIIPKVRDVPASGATSATSAAKAAGAESRKAIIPKIRDVPASGETSAPSAAASAAAATNAPIAMAIRPSTPAGPDPLPPGVPYASDSDPVTIVSYEISSTVFHPGDNVTGDIVTSSNVASVTAQVGTFSVAVPRVAPGKFHLQLQVPSVPLPPGDAKLVITAIRTDGKRVSRDVAITIAP